MGIIDSLVLVFLLTGAAHAYVFSCEEIKYKLLNKDFEVSTQFACLVPKGGGAPLDYVGKLDKVYAKADNVSTSFYEMVKGGCIERPAAGAWRIVSDLTNPLDCSDEIALIFSSTRPTMNVVSSDYPIETRSTVLSNGDEQVFVNVGHGFNLRVKQCTGAGNATFFTGAGTGEEENRFLLKSWRCADLSELIISFDTVFTIAVDSGVSLTVDYRPNDLDYSPNGQWHSNTQTRRLSSRSHHCNASGRSDNILNLMGYNRANFKTGKELTLSAKCDPCSFDPQFEGFIRLIEYDPDYEIISQELFRTPGSYALTFEHQLMIEYKSDSVSPLDVWDRQDTFVVELTFSEPTHPTEPAATVEEDPYCTCKVDGKSGAPIGWKATDVWLDVVVVLDTSEAMGEQALSKASALVESFFDNAAGGLATDVNSKFYTRIGVIAMADKPQVLYELNMTASDKVQDKVQIKTGLAKIDTLNGYMYAQNMLARGESEAGYRENARQVIYIMTDSEIDLRYYSVDKDYFKKDGGIVIVNDFKEPGQVQNTGLEMLASEGYYNTADTNPMHSMQLLCKANCFCEVGRTKSGKTAYRSPQSDPAAQASGGCLLAQPSPLSFSKARTNCDAVVGGRLVSVHDPAKAHALLEIMFDAAPKTFYFWMGYAMSDDGVWRWEDNSTNPYMNWDVAEPSPAAVAKCAYVDVAEQGLFWGAGNCNVAFPSACEFAPCAVGNMQC